MLTIIIGALSGLFGVLLGGAVRAYEAKQARRADAASLLSALCAEVEAVTRLMNHRHFMVALEECHRVAQQQVEDGKGDEPCNFLIVNLTQNYFSVFNASTARLGLLSKYEADRIVRFYTYLKAVKENYEPSSPFMGGIDANTVVAVTLNDMLLLNTVLTLGRLIASFRPVVPPPSIIDPFGPEQPPAQPLLPPQQS